MEPTPDTSASAAWHQSAKRPRTTASAPPPPRHDPQHTNAAAQPPPPPAPPASAWHSLHQQRQAPAAPAAAPAAQAAPPLSSLRDNTSNWGDLWGEQEEDQPAQQQQQQQQLVWGGRSNSSRGPAGLHKPKGWQSDAAADADADEGCCDEPDGAASGQDEDEEEQEEEVQLASADFDLSREEVVARIEQLALSLISTAALQQQLPTLSCVSTAASNVHMAPRHSAAAAPLLLLLSTAQTQPATRSTLSSAPLVDPDDFFGGYGADDDDAGELEGSQGAAAAAAGSTQAQQQQQQQQHVVRLGSRVQTKSLVANNGAQASSIVRALQLLDSVHALLRSGRSSTQRDVYYSLVGRPGFEQPRDVTSAIQSVLGMLRVPRAALGISAASKGAVAGCLLLRPGPGEPWVDCRSVGSSGRPIPGEVGAVDATAFRPAGARCILVVEKDAVFQSLVDSRLHEQLPCIIITGRGMPDIASRAFLAAVVEASRGWGAGGSSSASLQASWQQQQQPSLPVLGLVDWNPGGVGILLTYKYGCAGLGLESARYAVPSLAWLGVTADMLQEGRVPQSRCHALSARDRALLPGLRARLEPLNPGWLPELAEMEGSELKADIEALEHGELLRQLQRRVLQGNFLC